MRQGFLFHICKKIVEAIPIERVEARDVTPHRIGAGGRHEETESGKDTRAERADDAADLQQFRHAIGVNRAGAAGCHQCVAARVASLFGDVHTGCGGHVLVHDAVDAGGNVGNRQACRFCQFLIDHRLDGTQIQVHFAAEEILGR